ncbi:MAG: nucleoside phosphorylase [Polaribacter sp.]|jgi:nucleoside phosphorylase
MIDIVIICPVEVEFKIIRKIIINPKSATVKNLSFDFGEITTKHFSWNIAIIEPELNLNSFSLRVSEVIRTLNPRYVLLAGVAGGIKDPKIGDIVIGTKAYLYEGGKETEAGFEARPRMIENKSKELLTLAKRISREIDSADTAFYFGAIASGNKVLADLDSHTIGIIKNNYGDSQAVEMESYEFAQAASQLKKQYINIRGISDLIGGKAKSDSDGNQENAIKKVADFVKQFIYRLPKTPQREHYSFVANSSSKDFKALSVRKLNKTNLVFKDDYIEIKELGQTYLLRDIETIKHVTMGGDLRPNWVKIVFSSKGKSELRFYSDQSSLGINNWIGGSRKLLKAFREFEERQISLSFSG